VASALAPTMALRPDKQTLPDGSTVELNAGAEITVEFTAEKRGVRLVRGEAHFAVTKNAGWPFVVSAGGIDVKAVGTAFAVRFDSKQIDVVVTEGRVAVQSPSAPPEARHASDSAIEPIYLDGGARVALSADLPSLRMARVEPLSSAEVARALAWRSKRIEFTDTRLAEAVALFNRQNKVQIAIANRADETRCINGVFWADDPAGFARLLEVSLGLTLVQQGESIVLRDR
jgi:transmembrane sensor